MTLFDIEVKNSFFIVKQCVDNECSITLETLAIIFLFTFSNLVSKSVIKFSRVQLWTSSWKSIVNMKHEEFQIHEIMADLKVGGNARS